MADEIDFEVLCGEGGGGDPATCALYAVSSEYSVVSKR